MVVGQRGRFVRISDADPQMLRYLTEHGIALGDTLEIVEKQPFGGPVFANFAGSTQALGGSLAKAMRVEVTG
jgi:DtxR family transcriptional regulator, Mn-dependent transcriptional regulator